MELKKQIKSKKIKLRDVANELGMTMPTLKSKLDDPNRLTVSDIMKLRDLGITIKI